MNRHSGEAVLCKATSSGLEVTLFVSVPAVTALLSQMLVIPSAAPRFPGPEAAGLRLASKGLVPWFSMEVPADCECLPRNRNIPEKQLSGSNL